MHQQMGVAVFQYRNGGSTGFGSQFACPGAMGPDLVWGGRDGGEKGFPEAVMFTQNLQAGSVTEAEP